MNIYVFLQQLSSGKIIKVAFFVSQGSVDIKLRFSGNRDKHFIANFLLNPNVKKMKFG